MTLKVPTFPCAAELRVGVSIDNWSMASAIWIKASPIAQPISDLPEELALFDTGSDITIMSRRWALACGIIPFSKKPTKPLQSRLGKHMGEFLPVRFTLIETEGQPLAWEGEAWFSETWDGPSIIGWRGVLNHLRFHLDPGSSTAHFDLI